MTNGFDVVGHLPDTSGHVERVAGRLGDGEPKVEGDTGRNGAEPDDDAPYLVHGRDAGIRRAACRRRGCRLEPGPEAGRGDKQGQAGAELAETLHGKHRVDHEAPPLGRCKLGRDGGAQGVVGSGIWSVRGVPSSSRRTGDVPDANAHHDAPEDEQPRNGDGDGLSQ